METLLQSVLHSGAALRSAPRWNEFYAPRPAPLREKLNLLLHAPLRSTEKWICCSTPRSAPPKNQKIAPRTAPLRKKAGAGRSGALEPEQFVTLV